MTIITALVELEELIALGIEIETTERLTSREGLRRALHMWAELKLTIEADVRYLPAGQTIRPHVSLAAGVPALELA